MIIATGLDGVASDSDPGLRHDIDTYQMSRSVKGAPKQPLEQFSTAFINLKLKEWDSYTAHF